MQMRHKCCVVMAAAVIAAVAPNAKADPPSSNWTTPLNENFDAAIPWRYPWTVNSNFGVTSYMNSSTWDWGYPAYDGGLHMSKHRWWSEFPHGSTSPTDGTRQYSDAQQTLSFGNGMMYFDCKRINSTDPYVYGGYLNTAGKKKYKYGYFEMRAKLRVAKGGDAGFWLYADRYTWPPEIDIVEVPGGNNGNQFLTNVHYRWNGDYWGNFLNSDADRRNPFRYHNYPGGAKSSDNFYTYAVNWEPNRITWYLNGKELRRINRGVPREPLFLNIAYEVIDRTNSAFYGNPYDGVYPQRQEFDFVKVWQKNYNFSPVTIATGPDNKSRVVWQNTKNGTLSLWRTNTGSGYETSKDHAAADGWGVQDVAIRGDGSSVVLWTGYRGEASLWNMDANSNKTGNADFGPFDGWSPVDVEIGSDGNRKLLWVNDSGKASIWNIASNNTYTAVENGPFSGWTPFKLAARTDGKLMLAFRNDNNNLSLWRCNNAGTREDSRDYTAPTDCVLEDISAYGANQIRVLWRRTDNAAIVWTINSDWTTSAKTHGPFTGWNPKDLSIGPDGKTRLIWEGTGKMSLWILNSNNDRESSTDFGPY